MSDDLLDGLWLSVSEIARQKNKSRQAIAKRVDALVAEGKLETRPGEGGTKLVNLAQFDRAVGDTGDAFKESSAETAAEIIAGDTPASPALRDHQSRQAKYAADLKYLDLEERLGRVVPIDDVKDAAVKAGEAIVRIIDRLPTYAEAMTVVATKDGVQASRAMFKDIARDLRTAIADAMGVIAAEAVPPSIEPGNESEPA